MCKMAVKWCLTNLGHQVGSGGGGWGYCDQNANVTVMVTGSLAEEAQGTFPKKSSIAKRLQIGVVLHDLLYLPGS